MITLLLSRWRIILPFVLLLSMSLAVLYYKTRYERTTQAFEAYKADIVKQIATKEAENATLRRISANQIANIMANHQKQLADAKLDRANVTNKLKGSINEISDALTIAYDAIKLRNESTSNSAMSEIQTDSSGLAEAERNCNRALATVTEAAKVTDIDYEALYNAWKAQCDIGLCEK